MHTAAFEQNLVSVGNIEKCFSLGYFKFSYFFDCKQEPTKLADFVHFKNVFTCLHLV